MSTARGLQLPCPSAHLKPVHGSPGARRRTKCICPTERAAIVDAL
jgi:hypothetical protein